jgi:hypothetical protein
VRVDDVHEPQRRQHLAGVAAGQQQGQRGDRPAVPVDRGGVVGDRPLVDRQLPLGALQDRLRRIDRGLRLGHGLPSGRDLGLLGLETGLHLGGALLELVERPAVEHARGAAGLVAGRRAGRTGERHGQRHHGDRGEDGANRRPWCAPRGAREHLTTSACRGTVAHRERMVSRATA